MTLKRIGVALSDHSQDLGLSESNLSGLNELGYWSVEELLSLTRSFPTGLGELLKKTPSEIDTLTGKLRKLVSVEFLRELDAPQQEYSLGARRPKLP